MVFPSVFLSSLFVLFLQIQPAFPHEETCTFSAKIISEIPKSSARIPQGDGELIPVEIEILKARSMEGKLSYLDCEHWVGHKETVRQLLVPNSVKNRLAKGKIVSIDYLSRDRNQERFRFWTLSSVSN